MPINIQLALKVNFWRLKVGFMVPFNEKAFVLRVPLKGYRYE